MGHRLDRLFVFTVLVIFAAVLLSANAARLDTAGVSRAAGIAADIVVNEKPFQGK